MAYYQLAAVVSAFVQTQLCMHVYLNQAASGPNPTQTILINPSSGFGETVVNAWNITDAPGGNGNLVGHAQGLHIHSSQSQTNNDWYLSFNMKFEDKRFGGSTLNVMGIFPDDGEWSIVGGTGSYSAARGTIKHKLIQDTGNVRVFELHIQAFYPKKVSKCSL